MRRVNAANQVQRRRTTTQDTESAKDAAVTMKFFLAGIMQGSHLGAGLHEQDLQRQIDDARRESSG